MNVAKFFNSISESYEPLQEKETGTAQEDDIRLDFHEVSARLKNFKKPKSMVECGIFPDPATKYCDLLAIPLTFIYNWSFQKKMWPEIWRR